MATRQLGKLKYNISKRGIAYKWGDGEIHRFAFDRFRKKAEDEYDDQAYDDGSYQEGYDDGYGQDGYSQGGYAQDGYDDGYAQDGYDDGYGEYPEEEEEPQGGLVGFFEGKEWLGWLLLVLLPPLGIYLLWKRRQFETPVRAGLTAASAAWFVIALILLFSRGAGQDSKNPGTIVANPTSAPTAVVTFAPQQVASGTSTVAPSATYNTSAGSTGTGNGSTGSATGTSNTGTGASSTGTSATAAPSPTYLVDPSLISNTGSSTSTDEEWVYCTTNGTYYHTDSTCQGMKDAGRILLSVARSQGKTACPVCYGMGASGGDSSSSGSTGSSGGATATVYYATSNGTYYHVKANCSGMKGAVTISKADAEGRGQTPCPVCIGYYGTAGGTYYHLKNDCSGMSPSKAILKLKSAWEAEGKVACPVCVTKDTSTTVYWHTRTGKYYHVKSDCSGMKNATKVSLAAALAANQSPCPKCIGASGGDATYYCTDKGKYYHINATCSGMSGAHQTTKAAAEANGKTACPTCIGKQAETATKVYFTKDGTYYHKKENCSGMKGAVAGTIAQAKEYGKTACPTCIGASGTKVYCTPGGTYYHVVSNCSGMQNASYVDIAKAKSAGKSACPVCIGGSGSGTANANSGGSVVTTVADTSKVYSTKYGTYYHSNATCSGMSGAKASTITAAVAAGKTPCPKCMGASGSASQDVVYATKAGVYYHVKEHCSGMNGAYPITTATAIAAGKSACPVCVGSTGTKVYCTAGGSYYHVHADCSGMKNASFVTLKKAISLGKKACPTCIGSNSELLTGNVSTVEPAKPASNTTNTSNPVSTAPNDNDFTVYTTSGGTYYHTNATCSNMTGAKATSLAAATAAGRKPCPTCVKATKANMVYATAKGNYYHIDKTCSNMSDPATITVSLARSNGKTACPICIGNGGSANNGGGNAPAVTAAPETPAVTPKPTPTPVVDGGTLNKVYCTTNGKYYHIKSTCSGMVGAKATTPALARASGKTACPVCINPEKVTKVYVNKGGAYYHSKSICNGTKQEIATTYSAAVAAGYTGCPRCTGKKTAETPAPTVTPAPETTPAPTAEPISATRVYATLTSTYYHSTNTCDQEDLSTASYITVTKAQNYGKTACPKCMTDE